jgi:hypothetical protein
MGLAVSSDPRGAQHNGREHIIDAQRSFIMKQIIRYAIVLMILGGILLLAGNLAVSAGDEQGPALQDGQASVKGYVWNDADRDGVQDAGESGIRNVTVRLYDKDRKLVKNTKTDDSGRYQFEGITPGDYYVDILAPAIYTISPINQGQDEAVDSDTDPLTGETSLTTLVAGENILMWDAGLSRRAIPPQQDPGTVRPPPSRILITVSGTYSIGGFCTYTVQFLDPGVSVLVELERPLPRPLPDQVHAVRQGCRVTYYQNDAIINEFTPELGASSICFAATPAQNFTNYFYTVYAPNPAWSPTTDTIVESGVACSSAGPSAVYVGTFENP